MQVHIDRNGERHGPYSIEDINAYLANGTLLPTDLAWQDGMTDWLPVSQISGVVMFGGSVATPIPPSQPMPNGNKKKILIGIGAGMGLLALGVGIWFFFIREPGENDVHPTKPAKELTLEEKVAGTYEQRSFRVGGVTLRFSLASDGTGKTYFTEAQPLGELRWVVEGGEILIEGAKEDGIYRIESTGNLTLVAVKIDGKRKDIPKQDQATLAKLKEDDVENEVDSAQELAPEEEKVVGEYEYERRGFVIRFILLEKREVEVYQNGKKIAMPFGNKRWKIEKDGEIDIGFKDSSVMVYSINPDSSITSIAKIDSDGKREVSSLKMTFKKIK